MKAGNDRVIFGHMHEDHSLELSLVDRLPVKRALVIASGGDLAFSLAGAKVAVLAVDSNPAQIDLVRLKMRCPKNLKELCFCGRVDRVFRYGGSVLGWLFDWPDMRPGRVRVFLMDSLERFLPQVVSLIHGRGAGARLDCQAIQIIRRRLERAMRKPDAGNNPLLQVLVGNRFGTEAPEVWSDHGIKKWRSEIGRVELKTADIAQVLRESADDSLGMISVSNLLDVMESAAWDRLVEDASRVLVSGGYLIARSMLREGLESLCDGDFFTEENPVEDDSPLCPVIWVGRKR